MSEFRWYPRGSSAGFLLSAIPAGSRVAEQFAAQFGITVAEALAVPGWRPEHAAGMVKAKREAAEAAARRVS